MTPRQSEIITLIKKEVKPALGCTEPIAVALAVAKAMEVMEENCPQKGEPEGKCTTAADWRTEGNYKVTALVSGNILKNGMGVGIPGTGMVGLHIASALGAVCGKSCYGLEVLNDVCDATVELAKQMVEGNKVTVGLAETDLKLYVKASVEIDGHCAYAVIEKDHDNIVETGFDGKAVTLADSGSSEDTAESKSTLDYGLTVKEILEFASTVPYEDIEFILESRTLNLALANEGIKGSYGLKVGYAISLDANREVFGGDFLSYAMAMTAAASDARMAGCTLAAMSNSGSGNQGITVTMPVIAYSIRYGTNDEQLARALVLSHLIAIHIKGYLGKLSALCGCVIASTGASCGLVYLRGGDYEQICAAIKNMIGNITGMVCDGAKVGCAMKVASGVSSALQSAVLAREGICISEYDGIIEKDIEKTIQNLGRIGSIGMQHTDNMILDIMVCK